MFVLIISMQDALADSGSINTQYTDFFIPAVYPIENAWNEHDHDFTATVNAPGSAEESLNSAVGDDVIIPDNKDQLSLKASKKSEKDWVDSMMEKLPYKNTIKYTWDVVDGDVDLMGVKNLRADAGNRGLTYKTNYIPFAGNVEGTKIQADFGKDTELKFESDYVPLVGRVDGLKFKTSVGDGADISLRYNKAISW